MSKNFVRKGAGIQIITPSNDAISKLNPYLLFMSEFTTKILILKHISTIWEKAKAALLKDAGNRVDPVYNTREIMILLFFYC